MHVLMSMHVEDIVKKRGIYPPNRKRRGRKKNVVTLIWKPTIKFTQPISKERQLEIEEDNVSIMLSYIRVFTLFLPMHWRNLPTNQAQNRPRFPPMYHLATCNAPQALMLHGSASTL